MRLHGLYLTSACARKLQQAGSLQCRYTPAWKPGQLEEVDEVDLEELLEQMKFQLEMADRNARLIHPTPWQEAQVRCFSGRPQQRQEATQAVQKACLQ